MGCDLVISSSTSTAVRVRTLLCPPLLLLRVLPVSETVRQGLGRETVMANTHVSTRVNMCVCRSTLCSVSRDEAFTRTQQVMHVFGKHDVVSLSLNPSATSLCPASCLYSLSLSLSAYSDGLE